MKKKYFIITGYPRSRTAWLAALFCDGNVICFHEPVNKFKTLSEMKAYMDTLPFEYIGISDSSIGAYVDFYETNFSDAKIVVVDRDREDAVKDLSGFLETGIEFCNKIIDNLNIGLNKIGDAAGTLRVDFKSLDRISIIGLIWHHLIPTIPFNSIRCEIYQNLMIQQHKEKVLKQLN